RSRAIDGSGARGEVLTATWVFEAVLVLGGALALGAYLASSRPYCEACGQWCGKPRSIARLGVGDPARVTAAMERGDYAAIAPLVGREHRDHFWSVVQEDCSKCGKLLMV